jgi:DNA-binding response OmpR family regulator
MTLALLRLVPRKPPSTATGGLHRRAVRQRARRAEREERMPKVLVLSASGLVRFRVKKELKPRGFDVVDTDGSEGFAARAVRAEQPDVVLLDTNANSIVGERLVRSLKEDPTTSTTPLLLFSDDTPEARAAVLGIGADGVVSRRDDFDALAATISLHLKC